MKIFQKRRHTPAFIHADRNMVQGRMTSAQPVVSVKSNKMHSSCAKLQSCWLPYLSHHPLPSWSSLSKPIANGLPTLPHWLCSRSVILLTKLKLVDNSENAKKVTRLDKPYCIKLPKNNKVGKFGDVIKIAHRGKVHNALIVSNRMPSKWLPRYDSHNIILLNEKLEPVGTRILGPIPSAIRRKEGQYSKIIAIATKFI